MRSAAIPLVKDEISSYFYSLKSKVETELSNLQSHIASSLQKFVDAHVAKYGEAIGTLIREHRYKMQVLNNQIKQLNKSIRNLQQYMGFHHMLNMALFFLHVLLYFYLLKFCYFYLHCLKVQALNLLLLLIK